MQEMNRVGTSAWDRLRAGANNFKNTVKVVGKEMITSFAAMYVIATTMELIGKAFSALKDYYNDTSKSASALNDKFRETKNELSETESDLRNLESELSNTQDQIDTLMSSGPLSFTDQEELERLQKISAELEQQIELKKNLQSSLQKGTNDAAINAGNAYLDQTSFYSDISKTERQANAEETGKTIGQIAGLIIGGIIGAGITVASGGTALLVGAAVGGLSLGSLGGMFASGVAGEQYDEELSVKEAIANMNNTRSNLVSQQQTAEDAKAYNEATEALSNYDQQMAKHMTQMSEYYNSINWETAKKEAELTGDTTQLDAARKYADMIDTYNISMGTANAKTSAFERIFGEEADDVVKAAKEKYINALENGDDITLKDAFGGNTEAFEALKQRFYDMGLYIYEATNYLKDFKKELDETNSETNLYDIAASTATAEDAMSSLKSAFDEANESGQITAKTIMSLKETFGSIEGISDEWDNYVNVMMSGVASTEQMTSATEALAEAWLDAKLVDKPLDAMERISTITSLARIGVTNAAEYVDDAQKEAGYKAIVGVIKNKISRKEELLSKDILYGQEGNEFVSLIKDLNINDPQNLEYLTEIANQYGLTTDEVYKNIDTLKELAQVQYELDNANANNVLRNQYQGLMYKQGEIQGHLDDINETNQQVKEEAGAAFGAMSSKQKEEYGYIDPDSVQEELDAVGQEIEDFKAEHPGIDINTEIQETGELESQCANLENEIESKITPEIQLKLGELQDKSQLVDDIQSVFDTLASAQKEYNENGYFTVDTVQSLINLEPKYLALLYDENGNLNLNKDTLYNVAIARLEDMKLKAQDTILTEAETLATAGTIEALQNQVNANNTTADSYNYLIEQRIKHIKAILEERKTLDDGDPNKLSNSFDVDGYISGIQKQINAVERVTTSAQKNIKNTLSSSGNTAKADAESAFDKLKKKYEHQISNYSNQQTYLQNEIDRLQAENESVSKSYYEDQIAIEEKKLKLYEQERAELLALLSQTAKGTDEWLKYLARCNRNIIMYPFELLGNPKSPIYYNARMK